MSTIFLEHAQCFFYLQGKNRKQQMTWLKNKNDPLKAFEKFVADVVSKLHRMKFLLVLNQTLPTCIYLGTFAMSIYKIQRN